MALNQNRRTGFKPEKSQGSGPVFAIRSALQITQRELAERVGCSVPTIERCEASGTLPRSAAIKKLLEFEANKIGLFVPELHAKDGKPRYQCPQCGHITTREKMETLQIESGEECSTACPQCHTAVGMEKWEKVSE